MVDFAQIRDIRRVNKNTLAAIIREIQEGGITTLGEYIISGFGGRVYHPLNGKDSEYNGLMLVKKWGLTNLYNLYRLKYEH